MKEWRLREERDDRKGKISVLERSRWQKKRRVGGRRKIDMR